MYIYTYIHLHTHTHTHVCTYLYRLILDRKYFLKGNEQTDSICSGKNLSKLDRRNIFRTAKFVDRGTRSWGRRQEAHTLVRGRPDISCFVEEKTPRSNESRVNDLPGVIDHADVSKCSCSQEAINEPVVVKSRPSRGEFRYDDGNVPRSLNEISSTMPGLGIISLEIDGESEGNRIKGARR